MLDSERGEMGISREGTCYSQRLDQTADDREMSFSWMEDDRTGLSEPRFDDVEDVRRTTEFTDGLGLRGYPHKTE